MRKNLFHAVLIAVVMIGSQSFAEVPKDKQFTSDCFDKSGFSRVTQYKEIQVRPRDLSKKIKDTMESGYEISFVERNPGADSICTYHFKRSSSSSELIKAKLALYEKEYQKQLSFNPKLDQVTIIETGAWQLYTYTNHHSLDIYFHTFLANCDYKKNTKWDPHTREETLGLMRLQTLKTQGSWPNECVYYYFPNLEKINLVDTGVGQ